VRNAIVTVGTILNVAQIAPYWLAMFKKQAKPNIVPWFTWTLLTIIGSAAAFWHNDWQAGWVIAANAVGTGSIVVLGVWFGYAKMTRLDLICQGVALIGLASWPFFHDPTIAVITVVFVDIMAWLPTVHHAFVRPGEEVWQTYTLSMLASFCGLITLTAFSITNALYLAYLVSADIVLVSVILARRRLLATRAE
jgi:hypothetical protein